MEERRGPWFLITGLILGAAVGLLYAWVISPVRYVETSPSSLQAEFKDDYRSVIAAAYAADGDIGRARAKLVLLHDPDPAQALAAQAQQILAASGSQSDARQLAVLAAALVASTPNTAAAVGLTQTSTKPAITKTPTPTSLLTPTPTASLTFVPTATLTPGMIDISITSTASPSPRPTLARTLTPTRQTSTPLPTLTPTATLGAPFALKERSKVCDQTAPKPMLQVQINDASGNPVPGVKILISWQNGQGSFFTGVMPEINPGFAEYQLTPGVVYTIQLTDGGQPVSDIAAINCSVNNQQTYWGGWYLLLQQP